MATNQFDQYFGAEYVPQYTPLPIGELAQGLQYRQGKHEKNLAEMDQLEDLWANLKFLPQDEPKAREKLQTYRDQFTQFANQGDYSQASPFIRRAARAYMDDITSGYLGSTQQSYQNYIADMELIDKSDRPVYEKELAKRMRFNQYQGIDPQGELFSQVYSKSTVPSYLDPLKVVHDYLKDMKPTEIATSSPWFQTPDGLRWIKNSQKVEELPAEVLRQAGINLLRNDPKLQESLAFSANVQGIDPREYIGAAIESAATSSANILKRRNVSMDQDMRFTPEGMLEGQGSEFDMAGGYEDTEYDNTYIPDLPEDSGFKMGPIMATPYGTIKGPIYDKGEDYTDPKVLKESLGKDTWDNLSEFFKGDNDNETAYNIAEYLKEAKGKPISVRSIPISTNKEAAQAKGYLERNFLSRKFYVPSLDKSFTGKELLTNPDIRKSLGDVKGKTTKDILAEMDVVGRYDIDNPFVDRTGDKAFAKPLRLRFGDIDVVASMAADEVNSPEGLQAYLGNQATKARRSRLPQNLKELGMPEVKIMYNADGTYTIKDQGNTLTSSQEDLNTMIIGLAQSKDK